MPRILFVSAFSLLSFALITGCTSEDSPSSPADAGAAGSAPAGSGGSPGGAGGPVAGQGGNPGGAVTGGAGGAAPPGACTPEEEGSGGAPAYRPAPPPDDRACVVEGFELCTPGTEESVGNEATPRTLSRCENGQWKTLEAPSTCQPGVFPTCIRGASMTTGKATIHDNVCCTTPGYCDNLKATCDGTRWHMDPGYTEPPL